MIKLSTKANTLRALESLVTTCVIQPQVSCTVEELIKGPKSVESMIEKKFGNEALIVRSSAIAEDSENDSLAGKYSSIANVVGAKAAIEAAKSVASEYNDDNMDNQVLIQPMIKNVKMSGVIFTLDPNTGGNYFVINYDDLSGKTDSVTSGNGMDLKTYYLFRNAKCREDKMENLIRCANEIIDLFEKDNLDIEFAVDNKGEVYVLQVRALAINLVRSDIDEQQELLKRIHRYIEREMKPKTFIDGKSTIYGVMPDWNPAEIIGIKPKPLALSLYKYLVTDKVWANQRAGYGYKNLIGQPLMVDLCGLPYIDVRASFNSFVPKDIEKNLNKKLIEYYLNSLREQPKNHDKVEFEIIFSCYTFDIDNKMKKLKYNNFSDNDIDKLKQSLLNLTNRIINTKNGFWINDLNKVEHLNKRRNEILNSDMDEVTKIHWLLEDCIQYGTLPFAGLARCGFIAVELLKSLVNINIISDQEYEKYLHSLNSISSEMTKDISFLSKENFLNKYGHLRPGTYDITSHRYDYAHNLYFGDIHNESINANKEIFEFSKEQKESISRLMKESGIEGDYKTLFEFIKSGIEGREYAKFIFSKNVSDVLELIATIGEVYGYSREDMSYVDINIFKKAYSEIVDLKYIIKKSIKEGKEKYKNSLGLNMPQVILEPDDIYSFHALENNPNFITLGSIEGEVCTEVNKSEDIKGKIVLLRSADPGFDWIFTCGILGFVTAYGGVNSHMAIRASELGIPAIIGVGEKVFSKLQKVNKLHIDCANKKMEVCI